MKRRISRQRDGGRAKGRALAVRIGAGICAALIAASAVTLALMHS